MKERPALQHTTRINNEGILIKNWIIITLEGDLI